MGFLSRLRARVVQWFAAKPCERCGAPGCCVYLKTGVRVVEGPGGTSIGIRVNHRTKPPEWLCRDCAREALRS
jgi:hypothetical protein